MEPDYEKVDKGDLQGQRIMYTLQKGAHDMYCGDMIDFLIRRREHSSVLRIHENVPMGREVLLLHVMLLMVCKAMAVSGQVTSSYQAPDTGVDTVQYVSQFNSCS